MILGIGTDIIEVERILESLDKHGSHFTDRLFTEKEIKYCLKYKNSSVHFAGRFAAKEAVSKALGTGFGRELSWKDFEILNDSNGKPLVHFITPLEGKKVHISISHTENYAVATAILEEA